MATYYYGLTGNILFTTNDTTLTNDTYTFTNSNKQDVTKIIVGSNVISLNAINNTGCFENFQNLAEINIGENVSTLQTHCFKNCSSLTHINIMNSRSIIVVETECFKNTSSNINIYYYNARNSSSITQALTNLQAQLVSPVIHYIPALQLYGSNTYLYNPTTLFTSTASTDFSYFVNKIWNINYKNRTGPQYGTVGLISNALAKISITVFDDKHCDINVFNSGSNHIKIKLGLSMVKPGITNLYIYKLITNTDSIMDNQPVNFPVKLIFNNVTNTWDGELTSLSDYVILDSDGQCFIGSTRILMANGAKKQIQYIKRGEMIMTDIKTNSTNKVARTCYTGINGDCVLIPKNLIGNEEEIICTPIHPIWINNDTNRIYARDIPNITYTKFAGPLYNIQFEDESSYYVEGIKVDSLSPFHRKFPLPYELFFDKTKFKSNYNVKNEDDPTRNKPKIIKKYN